MTIDPRIAIPELLDLRAGAQALAATPQQYTLFQNAEPTEHGLAAKLEYWQIVSGALAYNQGIVGPKECRSLSEPLLDDNEHLTPVRLVAISLAFGNQRMAWRKKDGSLIWETEERWTYRVMDTLHALGALLPGWTKLEIEDLTFQLLDCADLAKFVGAVNAGENGPMYLDDLRSVGLID